jgi:surface antigen
MGDMRFYQIIVFSTKMLLIFFLTSCVSHTEQPSYKTIEADGIFLTEKELIPKSLLGTLPGFLLFANQVLNFSLNEEEKNLYFRSIYFALNNSEQGEFISWQSPNRQVFGKVRIVQTIHKKNKYCRVYQSIITVNSKSREVSNHACMSENKQWVFLK